MSGILNFSLLLLFISPFFYNPREDFYYCVSGLNFSFCNFHLSHLQLLNSSLSILISYGQQLLHCAGLLRNKIDALWHGGLQLQDAGPQTPLLPTEEWKAERLKVLSKSGCEVGIYFFGLEYIITSLLVNSRLRIVAFLLRVQQYQKKKSSIMTLNSNCVIPWYLVSLT